MDHHSWGPIEYGTTPCTIRHVYRNRDRCILYRSECGIICGIERSEFVLIILLN